MLIRSNSYTDRVAAMSGTLAMAMGLGCACVSTPYPFARDALIDGAGVLVPFEDSLQLSRAILYLLNDEQKAKSLGAEAARKMTKWSVVGRMVVELARSL